MSVGLSVCLYVSLPVCLSVSLCVFLSVSLSALISAISHQQANMQCLNTSRSLVVGLSVGWLGGVCEKVTYMYIHTYLPTYIPNNSDSCDSSDSCDTCDICDSRDTNDSSGSTGSRTVVSSQRIVVPNIFLVSNFCHNLVLQKKCVTFFLH